MQLVVDERNRSELCTDELFQKFVLDAHSVLAGFPGGSPALKRLVELADKAMDIEDLEDRIRVLEAYTFRAERVLSGAGFKASWDGPGYLIFDTEA